MIDNKMEIILSSGFMYLELTGKELTLCGEACSGKQAVGEWLKKNAE